MIKSKFRSLRISIRISSLFVSLSEGDQVVSTRSTCMYSAHWRYDALITQYVASALHYCSMVVSVTQ